jgi:glycosyltransferase involved in cell wall biosynthesis
MFFSIVIPIYNHTKYLNTTIQSLVNQKDFTDFEIIIVDDGSSVDLKESCDDICREIQIDFKYIKINNSGPGVARNIGVDNAVGEFIVFLDSDDLLYNQALAIYKTFIVKTGVNYFISKRNPQNDIQIAESSYSLNSSEIEYYFCSSYLTKKINPEFGASNIIVKRDIFRLVGGFDKPRNNSFHAEDHDLLLKLSTFEKFGVLMSPDCVVYRIHDTNSIHQFDKIIQGIYNLADKYNNKEYKISNGVKLKFKSVIGIPAFHWTVRMLKKGELKSAFKLFLYSFKFIIAFLYVNLPLKFININNERKSIQL